MEPSIPSRSVFALSLKSMLKVGNKVFRTIIRVPFFLQSYDSSGELTQAKLQLPETAGLAGIGSAQRSSRTESTGAAGQKKPFLQGCQRIIKLWGSKCLDVLFSLTDDELRFSKWLMMVQGCSLQ
jgi:hypothetical protein